MATEAIFQYRHKKFDTMKRSREDDSFASDTANSTKSALKVSPSKRKHLESSVQVKNEVSSTENVTESTERQIKIESESSNGSTYSYKIKSEFIELNVNTPEIPKEKLEDICKFRSNMVRKFPKKERSTKDQERRDKNTLACRRSRRIKKIEHVATEEEYKGYTNTNLRLAEVSIRLNAYFAELVRMTDKTSEIILIE